MAVQRAVKPKANPVSISPSEFKERLKRDGKVKVDFLGDLDHYDRTEVHGMDEGMVGRWCRARDMGVRERQGYRKVTKKDLKIMAPGNDKYWAPEGIQAKRDGEGLVLMEIPKEMYEARQLYKQLKRDEDAANVDAQLNDKAMQGSNPAYGNLLDQTDEFIQRLEKS